MDLPAYAELHALSNYSFQRGASHPEELVQRALALGYSALAITDECSLAGVVRAHTEARKLGLKLLIGAEFAVARAGQDEPSFKLLVLARSRDGYGDLSQFITDCRQRAAKGSYQALESDFFAADGHFKDSECLLLLVPDRRSSFEAVFAQSLQLMRHFSGRCWLVLELLHALDDALWLYKLEEVARRTGIPLVAAGDVHMHLRSRKPLQDAISAVRMGLPLSECGERLQPNAERHLRSRLRLAQLYPSALLAETVKIAARCSFSLEELRYEYPDEVVPAGETAASYLRRSTWEGAGNRFPQGIPAAVQLQIEHELALISELQYEKYFLTVYDIVRFARSQNILCQGRGSAANSAVCYCLGITEVDPARMNVLFERFISRERNEPPDIDVDFEHQRREEVIQYLYTKYGRARAALTATVVSYRPRSALRDMGKAMGIEPQQIDALAKNHYWWDGKTVREEFLREAGIDPNSQQVRLWLNLARQLLAFPRQLSQHPGGFVISRGPLSRLVPIENAAMAGRSVIQWDKDDIDALGLLKVDLLALGMLSAIRRSLDFISAQRGYLFSMQDIPAEDPATYDMICAADTVGAFQIESRAQQSMLPRLQPRQFYDLVIEVAIVRPGPIQGGMVHPYLRRHQGIDPVSYPSQALEQALGRTLGVPIFQEQVMQIAILAAGFSAGEADSLRRAMAAWKRKGGVGKFQQRLVGGMTSRGYTQEFAEAIFRQIEGFGEYGFPESHAASFALLVYASCWLKRHEPACFLAALLNSQPMGFYAPSQLVQDARRHGVEMRPADVLASDWDCTLEPAQGAALTAQRPAVRLGLRLISGLRQSSAERIMAARGDNPFVSIEDLAQRAELDQADLKTLAAADAMATLAGHRRAQVWEASPIKGMAATRRAGPLSLGQAASLLNGVPVHEEELELAPPSEGEDIVFDYAALGLTLRRHPLALLRPLLARKKLLSAEQMRDFPDGRPARACGIVIMRQQPETAKGTVFVTLEDESGTVNVIVWKDLGERQRSELLQSRLLAVFGVWQRQGEVRHLLARRLVNLTPWLGRLASPSRDFR